MILLIDIGNSRIKWTTLQPGAQPSPGCAVPWSRDVLEALFESQWDEIPAVETVWVANVAGADIEQWLDRGMQQRFGVKPQYARAVAELGGIRNSYHAPARLGVDRLVAMIAAYHRYQDAVCVVDCGTAVTVDLVDAEGVFRGGVIAPGSRLMRRALAGSTHALPPTDLSAHTACARSTEEAIAAGCLLSVSGLIGRVYDEFSRTLGGQQPRCTITGGGAPQVLPTLAVECDHEPDLVLHGLALLAGIETHGGTQ